MSTSQWVTMPIKVVLVMLGCIHEVLSKDIPIIAPAFEHGTIIARLNSTDITEASGLCASRIHPDVLYTHNDSGGKSRLFAISAVTGDLLMTIEIDGAHAQDWEDIACGPCNGTSGHCIYIADTGGNAGGDANTIYKIREPVDDLNHATGGTVHVQLESILEFSWDQHDCETVVVDNNAEVYVVSKVGGGKHPKFVRLPSNAWGSHHRVQVDEGVFFNMTYWIVGPVGGDISPNGLEVIVKTYLQIYYWNIPDGDYYAHMTSPPVLIPYDIELQGEAVCFDSVGSGYYTVSEGTRPALHYYRRRGNSPGIVG